jgi:HB1, ASXL, restriction endonuclease HTH domain
VTDPLDRIEIEISKLKRQLCDLETAARVLRSFQPESHNPVEKVPEQSTPSPPLLSPKQTNGHSPLPSDSQAITEITIKDNSFSGKTMAECAERLLRERGPMHYREVAEEAIRRGYRSTKGGSPDTLASSFWATLSRKPELFEPAGRGIYKLKERQDG